MDLVFFVLALLVFASFTYLRFFLVVALPTPRPKDVSLLYLFDPKACISRVALPGLKTELRKV